jgi:hypothetical protein
MSRQPSVTRDATCKCVVLPGRGHRPTVLRRPPIGAQSKAPPTQRPPNLLTKAESVSAGARIPIIPVEKCTTLGRWSAGLILETEEGRQRSGGETWMS